MHPRRPDTTRPPGCQIRERCRRQLDLLTFVLALVLAVLAGSPHLALATSTPAGAVPVRQAPPDLTVTKTNNVGGLTTAGSTWTWTFAIRNTGATSATFSDGQRFLLDNLPNASVSYPSVSVTPVGGASAASFSCAVDGSSNLICSAAGGSVTMPATVGGYDVTIQATTLVPGTYTDPRTGGVCQVDPDGTVPESNEGNNSCADTVAVVGPELTVSKTNDVGGSTLPGMSWQWTFTIRNESAIPTIFPAGQRLLVDTLPNANLAYGAVTVTPFGGATADVSCSIDGASTLTCTATGGGAIIPATVGGYTIGFQATPSAPGIFTNPRAGGVCQLDPDNAVPENDEANNTCANSVTVLGPDLTVAKANDVSGATTPGTSWVWTLTVSNAGSSAATFSSSQLILQDHLPDAQIAYLAPAVTNVSQVTGSANVSCAIAGNVLQCTATGTVVVNAGGSFQIRFTATPSAARAFVNPRAGGTCAVDPNGLVPEANEANNTCADTVTVGMVPPPAPPPEQAQAAGQDKDRDKPDEQRLTEAERLERERTNTAGEGDYRTEGNVLEVRCDASVPPVHDVAFPDDAPYLVIATIDGNQQLRLLYDTRAQCRSVRVGDYAEADGEKHHEHLFDAHNLTASR